MHREVPVPQAFPLEAAREVRDERIQSEEAWLDETLLRNVLTRCDSETRLPVVDRRGERFLLDLSVIAATNDPDKTALYIAWMQDPAAPPADVSDGPDQPGGHVVWEVVHRDELEASVGELQRRGFLPPHHQEWFPLFWLRDTLAAAGRLRVTLEDGTTGRPPLEQWEHLEGDEYFVVGYRA